MPGCRSYLRSAKPTSSIPFAITFTPLTPNDTSAFALTDTIADTSKPAIAAATDSTEGAGPIAVTTVATTSGEVRGRSHLSGRLDLRRLAGLHLWERLLSGRYA